MPLFYISVATFLHINSFLHTNYINLYGNFNKLYKNLNFNNKNKDICDNTADTVLPLANSAQINAIIDKNPNSILSTTAYYTNAH